MAEAISVPSEMFSRRDSDFVGGVIIDPPDNDINFATQDRDEEIYVVLRKAVITNFGWVLNLSFYFVLPIVIYVVLLGFGADISGLFPDGYLFTIPLIYYSVLITSAIVQFNKWYYNLLIITNKRFVNYSFRPLAAYKVSEANLDNIQDVSQSTIGVLPSVFGYGDLLIQTASQLNKFRFRSLPRPTWVRNTLVDLAAMSRQESRGI